MSSASCNTGSLISVLSRCRRGRGGRDGGVKGGVWWKIIEVSTPRSSPLIQEWSSIWAAGAHFHANNGVAIFFFSRRFPPNSFLQMMCHYKEVYLNKFNTSLINPRRAPFKRSHATSGRARYNPPPPPPPPPTPPTPHITVLAQGWRGGGRQEVEKRGGGSRGGERRRELYHGQLILSKSLFTFLFSY